jgi:hypothetical protein
MAMIGRLTIATLMASGVSMLFAGLGLAIYWAFQPHWVIALLFVLCVLGFHIFALRRSYFFVKEHWF